MTARLPITVSWRPDSLDSKITEWFLTSSPVYIAVAVVLRLIDAFRVYDIIFMTTRGGPVDVTQTLSWQ
jgi:hypothetical protein